MDHVTGKTKHYLGRIVDGEVCKGDELPAPAHVEIHRDGDAYFLFYLDANGRCIADTWHQSVEAAKAQARFEFEIGDDDWEDVAS